MGGFTNAFPPVIAVYFASLTIIPVWPWFPLPKLNGVVAAIAVSSLSVLVMLCSVGWPKILEIGSFQISSLVSTLIPIVGLGSFLSID